MNLFKKQISSSLVCAFAVASLFSSCLDSNQSETVVNDYSNALITATSLSSNTDVCSDLSSYSFTIDQLGQSDPALLERCSKLWKIDEYSQTPGIIFNPDSLPVGSIADSIKVSLSTTSASEILFLQYDEELNLKKTTNYADTQIIWFDDYAIHQIKVTAADGGTNKSYFMKMNIHTCSTDTVRWKYLSKSVFDASEVADQRVDTIQDTLYWYTTLKDQSQQVRISTLSNPSQWSDAEALSAPAAIDLGSLLNWKNTLYAVAADQTLLSSTDGKNWTVASAELKFVNILGAQLASRYCEEHLCAIVSYNDEYHFGRSSDGLSWSLDSLNVDGVRTSQLPAGFPIAGFSRPIATAAKPTLGTVSSRLYICCGMKADSTLTASTWCCDGRQWAEFPQNNLCGNFRPAIIRYTLDTDYPDTFWIMQTGTMANDSVSNVLYFSENSGVTWKKLKREFSYMADTDPILPYGCTSAFHDAKKYNMYFFGGVNAQGEQESHIVTGQLTNLSMNKLR